MPPVELAYLAIGFFTGAGSLAIVLGWRIWRETTRAFHVIKANKAKEDAEEAARIAWLAIARLEMHHRVGCGITAEAIDAMRRRGFEAPQVLTELSTTPQPRETPP